MKCCGEVIKNTALGKDFYYCRGCKQELVPLVPSYQENPPEAMLIPKYNPFQVVAEAIAADLAKGRPDCDSAYDGPYDSEYEGDD